MGKLIDITGQKFGRLTVIKKSTKRNASGQVYWWCLCECGKECEVCGSSLRSGHTKSCGCFSDENHVSLGKNHIIDRVGQRYGKLIVLERATNIDGKSAWKCKCDCGNICIKTGDSLQRGNVKSCGCIKISCGEERINDILTQANINFETEKTFSTCILPSGKYARFDFYVNNKYLIEFDGKQHFLSNAGWGEDIAIIQNRDKIKTEWCEKNNIPLIRIPYTHLNEICLEDLLLETSQFIIKV